MTLKERFKEEKLYINPYSFKLTVDSIENFEQIADEFAIEFAQWINSVSYRSFDGNWYLTQIDEDIKKTTEELLEIFKKEKGL
jgi:hypothetical protein